MCIRDRNATGLSGNPSINVTDLDVDGHTNLDNVSIAGVSTVTTFLQVLGTAGTSDKGLEVRANSTQNTDTNQAIRVRNNSNTDTFKVSYKGYVNNRVTELTEHLTTPTAYLGDSIIHHGDLDTKIRFPANDTISFETAGTEKLRITSNGQIGIGTATIRNSRAMQLTGESNTIFLMTGHAPSICLNRDPDDSSDGDRSFFGVSSVSNGFANGTAAGDTIIRGNSSGKLHFATSTSIRMSIASGGDTTPVSYTHLTLPTKA